MLSFQRHRISRLCCLLLLIFSLLHLAFPCHGSAVERCVASQTDGNGGSHHDGPSVSADSEEPGLFTSVPVLPLPLNHPQQRTQLAIPTPPGPPSLFTPPE